MTRHLDHAHCRYPQITYLMSCTGYWLFGRYNERRWVTMGVGGRRCDRVSTFGTAWSRPKAGGQLDGAWTSHVLTSGSTYVLPGTCHSRKSLNTNRHEFEGVETAPPLHPNSDGNSPSLTLLAAGFPIAYVLECASSRLKATEILVLLAWRQDLGLQGFRVSCRSTHQRVCR